MYETTLEEVITFRNYFRALKDCNKSVNFKFSVQNYNANCMKKICATVNRILNGEIPNVKNNTHVTIRERGKERTITPIDIEDRVTQKVLCDNVLVPAIAPHLIYDNGASLKGKGTQFARKRLNLFIEKAKREYGRENIYALIFDFKSYFDSIPHCKCREVMEKYIEDQRIVELCMGIIESYETAEADTGLCLGSQISQVMAVAVPNDLDHYIKDILGMKYYIRYMDDGIILLNDKRRLSEIKKLLSEKAKECGLAMHPEKTKIIKLTHGITFLKIKYRIVGNKTIKRLTRPGIVRERRKLKKLSERAKSGRLPPDDIYASMQSWNAHSGNAKSYRTSKNMFRLYNGLYGGYRMTQKYYRNHPEEKRRKKVTRF